MKKLQIIPAIDIIEGKCVRLTKGDYSQKKIYNENPLEIAKEFEGAGINRLHLVDLDGAKSENIVNRKVLETIASKTGLIIDFGGGIKTDKDIKTAFDCGAAMVNIGSIAVRNRELFLEWLRVFGNDKIILSADVADNKIASGGWLEESDLIAYDYINSYVRAGVKKIVCTDISKDGMLTGSSIELYTQIMKQNPNIELIASGGFTSLDEFPKLEEIKVSGIIIGKAIYENKVSLKDLSNYILN